MGSTTVEASVVMRFRVSHKSLDRMLLIAKGILLIFSGKVLRIIPLMTRLAIARELKLHLPVVRR